MICARSSEDKPELPHQKTIHSGLSLMVNLGCGELFVCGLKDSRDSCDFTSVKGGFSFCNLT